MRQYEKTFSPYEYLLHSVKVGTVAHPPNLMHWVVTGNAFLVDKAAWS